MEISNISTNPSRSRLNKESLTRLTGSMQSYVERGEVAGLVTLVYRRGEIAHLDVIGMRDREAALPMQRDIIFRLFSMTKPVMAVAALSLVDESLLRLDDPIDQWLPELANRQVLRNPNGPLDGEVYPSPRPITLRDLLTYRAGTGWQFESRVPYEQPALELTPFPVSTIWTKNDLPGNYPRLGLDAWLHQLGKLPLRYAPGERWLYNVPSDILGALLVRVSGMPLGTLLRQRIFEPLDMKDTGFWVPAEKMDRFSTAFGTSFKSGQETIIDQLQSTVWGEPPLFESGGGGLVSTIDDYLQFGRMLLNKGESEGVRILSRTSVEAMTTDHLTPEQHTEPTMGLADYWRNVGFGFGVSVVTGISGVGPSIGSYSWGGALGTNWINDPQEEMVIFLMQQRANPQSKISEDFISLVYQAIKG